MSKVAPKLTPKQKAALRKIEDLLQAQPFGVTLDDFYKETGLSMTVIKNALDKMPNVQKRGNEYFLNLTPAAPAPVEANEVTETVEQPVMQESAENLQDNTENMQECGGNTQDDGGNTQDDGGNTQAPRASYPNNDQATLINPSAGADESSSLNDAPKSLINPNTGREYIELPETGATIKKLLELAAERAIEDEEFELQPPPVHQKHFVLIENCYLSLAQDGTSQEPSLAKDTWFDDEGDEVEEEDCKVLNRAREPHVNEIEFKGVTYRNLFVAESQLFHGIFDDIQAAKDRMDELMAKKPSNNFELLEV